MENPQKSNQEELKTLIEIEDYSDQKGSFSATGKRSIIQTLKTMLEKNNFDHRLYRKPTSIRTWVGETSSALNIIAPLNPFIGRWWRSTIKEERRNFQWLSQRRSIRPSGSMIRSSRSSGTKGITKSESQSSLVIEMLKMKITLTPSMTLPLHSWFSVNPWMGPVFHHKEASPLTDTQLRKIRCSNHALWR